MKAQNKQPTPLQTKRPERPLPLPQDPIHLLNLGGFIQTVTSIPTETPRSFYDQVKLYTDSLSSPTTYRLYMYSQELDDWLYVTLST